MFNFSTPAVRLIAVMAFILPGIAFATPDIERASGDLEDGEILTIHGNNFGSFGGRIISWDDFEGHDVGQFISQTPAKIGVNWTTQYNYKGPGISVDDEHAASGKKAVKIDWGADDGHSIRAFGWSEQGPLTKLYISYERWMQGVYDPGEADNHKQFYLFGTGKSEFPQFMPLMPARTDFWSIYNNSGQASSRASGERGYNGLGLRYANTQSVFQRWEWGLKLNNPVSAYNGIVKGWVDGKLGWNIDDYKHTYVEGAFDDFRLGHMAQGFYDTAEAWFDDVYVATTPARAELCAEPRWELCGSEKTLLVPDPAAWQSDELQVTLRGLSSFASGPTYLYVITADGEVNQKGYLLKSPPKPPGSLTVEIIDN